MSGKIRDNGRISWDWAGNTTPAPPSDGLIFSSQISTLKHLVTATGHDIGLGGPQEVFSWRETATNKAVMLSGRSRAGLSQSRPSCHQIVIPVLTMGSDNHNIANNFHSEFDTNFQLRAEDEK